MYIYKGRLIDNPPTSITAPKKIKVQLEDVLLTFLESSIQGSSIIIEYAISYFNIPQSINEYDIEAHIDRDSLQSVIKKTVGELGKYMSIYYLSAKAVKFAFDAKAFLLDATFPTNIVKSAAYNVVELKLNRHVPPIVEQTSETIMIELFGRVMNTIIRNSPKYGQIITGLNRLKVSRSMVLNTYYNPDKNSFTVEIKDPLRILYYYTNKGLYNSRP